VNVLLFFFSFSKIKRVRHELLENMREKEEEAKEKLMKNVEQTEKKKYI
jgi:UDP-2,3-diacylglucosamine pyrophosphatase LpxH